MGFNKTLAIIGAVHGDEEVGVQVIRRLKKLVDGENIVGIVANNEALKRDKRFIIQDLNRSFPGDPKGNLEERLAYRLTKKIKKFDYILDLHSFSCRSDPFAMLTKKTKRHLKLAKASGINKVIFMSAKLASGRALIDHCHCGISIETGRHDLESTFKKATFYTENILKALGFLKGKKRGTTRIDYFEIIDVFFKNGDEKIVKDISNFKLVRKGEVIARGRRGEYMAPYDFYPILARERAYPDILCLTAKSVKMKRGKEMRTKQVYYQDPYKKEIEAIVVGIEESAGSLLSNIVLNQTVFFPEGGGQPGDRGEIVGKKGSAKIEYTRMTNGKIIHQGKIVGGLAKGDKVKAKIDWNWRYKYMKIHSAGHLVHDVLTSMVEGLTPLKGSHGKKAYLEYEGSIDSLSKETLEEKVNEAATKNLPIVTKDATYEELVKECQFVPPNLPRDKKLRMLKIGDYSTMPDGGVHVKSTKEIGKVWIANIVSQDGKTVIRYGVAG